MVTRLLLALLLGFASLPMVGAPACHAATAAAAANRMHAGHHKPVDRNIPVENYCIGCVPPATLSKPEIAPPSTPKQNRTPPPRTAGARRTTPAPATPPPRAGS